jgi:hypothetical protein
MIILPERNMCRKKKYKKYGSLFCKVPKSVYICISKQEKVALPLKTWQLRQRICAYVSVATCEERRAEVRFFEKYLES